MDKKFFIAMSLSLVTVFLWHYFGPQGGPVRQFGVVEAVAAKGFRVPSDIELSTPLFSREIDFLDAKISKDAPKEALVALDTDLCRYEFSNYGGVIAGITYEQRLGKSGLPLKTVSHKDFFHREECCLLLALEEKTPYFYTLVSQVEHPQTYELVYQTSVDTWRITKTYLVYKDSYRVDLSLRFELQGKEVKPITARLFFPAPYLAEVVGDAINGFAFDGMSQSIDKKISSKVYEDIFGTEDRYFAHALIADPALFVQFAYYKKLGDNTLFSILKGPEIKENATYSLSFYFGPKDFNDLHHVDSRLEGLIDFGWWPWLSKLLLQILELLYRYLKNYGLAIIALTILFKIPLLPITIKSGQVMERYQKYQPHINRIRAKYRHNLQQQQAEIMRFHKEHNLSPATPMVGCLPLLIDIPIMWALYKVLYNYMNLYQAPFALWIVDLSSKDPYYVLPILMGVTMFWQQKMSPISDEKQQVMMIGMSVLMTALFANFAAGLVLYWLTKNVLTIGETYLRKALFKTQGP